MARRFGATEDQLLALSDAQNSDQFTPAEKAAIFFAEAMTSDASSIDDALFERLRAHYDEGEVVEIACVVGLFNYFNRWNQALATQITDPATAHFAQQLMDAGPRSSG